MSTPNTRRWLPFPALSVLLALLWLLLQQSLAPGNLIAAAAFGLLLPRALRPFLGQGSRPRHPLRVLRFTALVLWDIVVSNLVVARLVLSPWSRPQPAWVEVPLDATHPVGIALLGTIITTTPGTVSCTVDEQRRCILVHALDCHDPAALAAQIKARYELPLRQILEGVES